MSSGKIETAVNYKWVKIIQRRWLRIVVEEMSKDS
jgi:hypothetical protein